MALCHLRPLATSGATGMRRVTPSSCLYRCPHCCPCHPAAGERHWWGGFAAALSPRQCCGVWAGRGERWGWQQHPHPGIVLPALTLPLLLPQPVWYKVRPLRQADLRQRLGAASAGQRLPPRLLRLLLLQAAALHRRGVRLGGGEGAVPDSLRHHDREPQASSGKRYAAPTPRSRPCPGPSLSPVVTPITGCRGQSCHRQKGVMGGPTGS